MSGMTRPHAGWEWYCGASRKTAGQESGFTGPSCECKRSPTCFRQAKKPAYREGRQELREIARPRPPGVAAEAMDLIALGF